jgi:hypothetical protein
MGIFYSQRQRVYLPVTRIPQTGELMAVVGGGKRGGKHLTIFFRKPTAPGAGKKEVKDAFTSCAHETLGISSRPERNDKIRTCVPKKLEEAKYEKGIFRKKSRAKPGSPLHGKVYVIKGGKVEIK